MRQERYRARPGAANKGIIVLREVQA